MDGISSKHIIPNSGLMVLYHNNRGKNITLNTSKTTCLVPFQEKKHTHSSVMRIIPHPNSIIAQFAGFLSSAKLQFFSALKYNKIAKIAIAPGEVKVKPTLI